MELCELLLCIYIYIYNFFLTRFYRCVNCYGSGIAGADELKNLSQWLNGSINLFNLI